MGEDNVCHANWDIVPGGGSSRTVLSLELVFPTKNQTKNHVTLFVYQTCENNNLCFEREKVRFGAITPSPRYQIGPSCRRFL